MLINIDKLSINIGELLINIDDGSTFRSTYYIFDRLEKVKGIESNTI